MSELTQCNHCSLRNIYYEANRNRQRVVILPARKKDKWFMGGEDVFRFPKALYTRAQFRKLDPEEQQKHWLCWFMELTDHCVC